MRLPEVIVFFKKNKRRRGLLICISFVILWLLTLTVILTPCISCSEDSRNDPNPSTGYEKNSLTTDHLVALPNEKPNNSRNGNIFFNFRLTRDLSLSRQRQWNSDSFGPYFPNQSINTKTLIRDAKQGYLLRSRKYNALKRRARYRRQRNGSGDENTTIEASTATHSISVTEETTATTLANSSTGRIIITNSDVQTTAKFTTISSSPDDVNTSSLVPYSPLPANVNTSSSSTESSFTSMEVTTAETATTNATTPLPSTTAMDPCRNVNALAPSRVFFPPKHLLAYQMNVRISMGNSSSVPDKYNVTIHHNGNMVVSRVAENRVFTIQNLLPCKHYTACVVALFEGCPESQRICNDTTTATNITSVEIQNLTLNSTGTRDAVIQFDLPETTCKLNYSITVNGTIWKFNANNSFALISSNETNNNSIINCTMTEDSNSRHLFLNLSDLSPYTPYHIEVWAESDRSKSLSGETDFETKPSAPTLVRNGNATCFTNNAWISWEPPDNFHGKFQHYEIVVYDCGTNETKCQQVKETNVIERNYNFSLAQPGHQYQFKIRATTINVTGPGQEITKTCTTLTLLPLDNAPATTVFVVAWVLTFILLLTLLGFILIALQRKKIINFPYVHKWCSGRSSQDPHSVAIPFRVTTKPCRLVDIEEYYGTMTADSSFKFSQEFEELVSGSPSRPTTVAHLSENRVKNRWINILPFDHSRVKLLPIADDIYTDYINASYIPGYRSQREFIASQGPLSNTKDDFWRMVWEQNSPMIVMVTQCIERGKEKCEQYWPEDRETHYYGDLAVKLKSESILTGYTLRIFDLHLKVPMTTSPTAIDLSDLLELIPRFPEIEKGSRTMEVKQMHFTMWPDFGCPENTSLLINFVGSVRDHMPHDSTGPVIVHCSAGVGRTGTFIAVDKLMQHIEDHDFVDIYGTVREMRDYRTNMVQTEDQYMYIHECVKDLFIDMQTRTPISKNSGESMIDILGMAQSDTPSSKRRTESSVRDLSDPEMTETTVLLSVTTGASDLTDAALSELTDTTSMLSEHAFSEPEPHGDADKFDNEFERVAQQPRLSSTNRMSHDPKDTFHCCAVGGESLSVLPPIETTQAVDATDIPLSNLIEARSDLTSDIWYF